MAKKATAKPEVKPAEDPFDKLDVAGLNDVINKASAAIQKAKMRIRSLDENTKEKRIEEFKNSEFYKSIKQKAVALDTEIKSALKEFSKDSFEANITFTIKVSQSSSVVAAVFEGGYGDDIFDYDVNAGKVTGDKLTKNQKQLVENEVDNHASEMCDDGIDVLFPKLSKKFKSFEEKTSDLMREVRKELNRLNLSWSDL